MVHAAPSRRHDDERTPRHDITYRKYEICSQHHKHNANIIMGRAVEGGWSPTEAAGHVSTVSRHQIGASRPSAVCRRGRIENDQRTASQQQLRPTPPLVYDSVGSCARVSIFHLHSAPVIIVFSTSGRRSRRIGW